jgi:hypothetical protein
VPPWMILPYLVLWAVFANALFVKAHLVPPTCVRCGRRPDGDVCYCGEHAQR